MSNQNNVEEKTQKQYGKITYVIEATHNHNTNATIETKIENLILRDLAEQERMVLTNIS